MVPFKPIPTIEALAQGGAAVCCSSDAQLLLDGLFYVSGEIPHVTSYERGLPNHMRQMEHGTAWEPDPLILDERFLAVEVKGKGVIVFTVCSHAGVVNVLTMRKPCSLIHRSMQSWAGCIYQVLVLRRSSRRRSGISLASG